MSDLKDIVRELLLKLDIDPSKDGLSQTPERVAESLRTLLGGYKLTASDVVQSSIFVEKSAGTVMQKNNEFYSLCEHHMLPFFGHIHVAYQPNQKIIGLSEIQKVIDVFARRLQLQERLTEQIADALFQTLQPHGVAVTVEAKHLCMLMRRVGNQNGLTITKTFRGNLGPDFGW